MMKKRKAIAKLRRDRGNGRITHKQYVDGMRALGETIVDKYGSDEFSSVNEADREREQAEKLQKSKDIASKQDIDKLTEGLNPSDKRKALELYDGLNEGTITPEEYKTQMNSMGIIVNAPSSKPEFIKRDEFGNIITDSNNDYFPIQKMGVPQADISSEINNDYELAGSNNQMNDSMLAKMYQEYLNSNPDAANREHFNEKVDPTAFFSSLAGDAFDLLQKQDDPNYYGRLSPNYVDYGTARDMARREAATAQAIANKNARNLGGAGMTYSAANNALLNQNLGNMLSDLWMKQNNYNRGLDNQYDMHNQRTFISEDIANRQDHAALMSARSKALHGIGEKVGGYKQDVARTDAMNKTNMNYADFMKYVGDYYGYDPNQENPFFFRTGSTNNE